MKPRIVVLLVFCIVSTSLVAQQLTPKILEAKRTIKSIKMDGLLTDSAWADAAVMTDLIEMRPNPGYAEQYNSRTIAYLMYNDDGIYFGGYCYEPSKDSIVSELTGRDGFGTNDFIGIIFDTYYDRLNGFEYFLTPLNEQWDARMWPNPNGDSEDFSWNAVWESATAIHNDGWSFEMFIPYGAIRFPNKKIQDWGFHITRRRNKTGQQFTWNPVSPNISGFLTQEAVWKGIEDIKPPVRLQFSPYFSTYVNHFPSGEPNRSGWTSAINGGMDVKYGINQAITLDMTLIPDFGQVQSDNQVLNLSPFEVKFNEYRNFFTEGTELFNMGNLFYSRRVGGMPLGFYSVRNSMNDDERILKNPTESKIINATKISGRLPKGLGIGFFNALTAPQYAVVEDDEKNRREIETNPLTNYNILVLNQSMKNNSSVSFINTNVLRSGSTYDANVSAALFDLNDKGNMWNVGGKMANSVLSNYLPGGKNSSGYSHELYFGKKSGRFRFNLTQELTDEKFTSNDLGYFTYNNFLNHSLWAGYRWIKPSTWYNNLFLNANITYLRRLKEPSAFQAANFNMNVNGQLKNLWYVGMGVGYEPKGNDFNEPRIPGRMFKGWSNYYINVWAETNYAKKYGSAIELLFVDRNLFSSKRYMASFNHRFRFNNNFSISHSLYFEPQTNNVGFANLDNMGNIIFGRRDRNTIENTFTIKYNFNSRMGLNTRLRHYWSKVDYKDFFTLLQNGGLEKHPTYTVNEDRNVNFFNIDMVYTWQFAAGSFLNVVWKNAIFHEAPWIEKSYLKNIDNTFQADQNNNLSVKVIYFLDYLQMKKWGKKKKNLLN